MVPPMLILAVAIAVHVLAAVIWVGGMFMAFMFVRPAADPLAPADRLPLWRRIFDGFFPWVWTAIVALFASGYYAMYATYGGFDLAPLHIHLMHGIAIVMTVLYAYLFFVPYRALRHALDVDKTPEAAAAIGQIRPIIAVNLVLGLVTVAIGSSGPSWG